jgi:hypothetical protein
VHGEDKPVEAAPDEALTRIGNDIGDVIVLVAQAKEEYHEFNYEDHQVLCQYKFY